MSPLFLPLLFGLVLLIAAALFYLYLRRTILSPSSLVCQPSKQFPGGPLVPGREGPELIDDKKLSPAKAIQGLNALSDYAAQAGIEKIIGINRGGILVGAYVALRLRIKNKDLLRCSVPLPRDIPVQDGGDNCSFTAEDLKGKILVVDDVCRTGKTLEKAMSFLGQKIGKDFVKVATLVSTIDDDGPGYDRVNYYAFATQAREILMPWHTEEAEIYVLKALEQKRIKEFEETKKKSLNELQQVLQDAHLLNGRV